MTIGPEKRRAARRLYIDTSAYLCILLGQEGSERLARERHLRPEQYQRCIERVEQDVNLFQLRDLTLDLCQSIMIPAVAMPRSLDLAHLRTALWFHAAERIDRFVTVDASQEQAAKEIGLPVA